MKTSGIKTNFIFQIFYQIVVLVLPLAMYPILTRNLGDTELGNFTYVNSISFYFVIFAMLGITKYGQRLISQNRDDNEKLRKSFWSLFFTHIITSFISLVLYFGFILLFVKSNSTLFWIHTIYIIAAMLDITWLFYGLENFKFVVLVNFIIKVSTFLCVCFFIHSPNDVFLFAFLELGSILLGYLFLFPIAFKIVPFIRFNFKDCIVHIKPLLILSLSVIATTLYVVFDKTLIGNMINVENVAYYEYSNKLINVPKTLISVIGVVLFPRACSIAVRSDKSLRDKYSRFAYLTVAFISFASIFGISIVGKDFVVIYYGEDFYLCGDIMVKLCPIVFLIGMADVFRSIYLIPAKKDFQYILAICISSVINIAISGLLIPLIGVDGAIIGTLVSEIFSVIYMIILCRKEINFKDLFKAIIVFIVIGFIMFITLYFISLVYAEITLKAIILKVLIGAFIYLVLTFIAIFFLYTDVWEIICYEAKKNFKRRK